MPTIRAGYFLWGKIEFVEIDKKIHKDVGKEVSLRISEPVRNRGMFVGSADETLKKLGVTSSSWICLVLETYNDLSRTFTYPLYPDYFEIIETPDTLRNEVERRFKGMEEVVKLLEFTGVAGTVKGAYDDLVAAYRKFKSSSFEDSKTSIRKALEELRPVIRSWSTVDNSEHLADGIQKLAGSLYDLSSSGGPHKGVASQDETEVILNSTLYLFRYLNKIIKDNRMKGKPSGAV